MTLRNPLVLVSGFQSELPPGDLVPGQDSTAQASGNAALALASTALASGNDALGLGTVALASGNAALFDAGVALASGNAALVDAAAAFSEAGVALASGNAALVDVGVALASGNAALTDLDNKYDKTGGPISGPVVVQSQSFGEPEYVISSGVCILNFGVANNFEVVLTSGSTFASPVNASGGQSGLIVLRQDSTGSQLVAYSGSWSFVNDTPPVLTTTASGVDALPYYVVNPERVLVVPSLNYGSGTIA